MISSTGLYTIFSTCSDALVSFILLALAFGLAGAHVIIEAFMSTAANFVILIRHSDAIWLSS